MSIYQFVRPGGPRGPGEAAADRMLRLAGAFDGEREELRALGIGEVAAAFLLVVDAGSRLAAFLAGNAQRGEATPDDAHHIRAAIAAGSTALYEDLSSLDERRGADVPARVPELLVLARTRYPLLGDYELFELSGLNPALFQLCWGDRQGGMSPPDEGGGAPGLRSGQA